MKSFTQVLRDVVKEEEKYFKNYLKYASIAKKVVERELGDAKVFVFGSVVKGKATPASDVDLLILSKRMPERMSERSKIKAKIWKEIGIFSPFEIHLVDEKEFEWYKKFIDKKIEV